MTRAEKTNQELLELIEEKEIRIKELEDLLRQHGVFVLDKNRQLTAGEKIEVFMDYFHGREDLFAERYYSKKKDKYGWGPVCDNSFGPGCPKSNGRFNCFQCSMSSFRCIDKEILRQHFTGKNKGIGIYPLQKDHSCYFLALDFDDDSWFEDMLSVYRQAIRYQLCPVMERSQSGCGGHLWFFFATAVKARDARRLGEYLTREAMNSNRKLKFSSFDRMFPNQDYVPENGAGNLIALPLRYDAFIKGNSAFIDEQGQVIQYPIEYLASRKKITIEEINSILSSGWDNDYFFENDQLKLSLHTDMKYSKELSGKISSMIRLEKKNMNAATVNLLTRCASMYNPKYYEMQRLHKPIYLGSEVTRVLSYYEEDDQYLYLPRGILPSVQEAMPETVFNLEDGTQHGKSIDVSFKESLRSDQINAAETLLKFDMGILQASPGFGKTVVAIDLISQLKVNTLILVDSQELQNQWEERLERFLEYPHAQKKKDRFICKYNGSTKRLNGNIDIAMVRSLRNAENIDELVSGYGLTIIDECHHVACDSFLHVMRHITSKYIYGLSATPKRDDGLFKVITMFCGPVRKKVSRNDIREGYSFKQLLIPRYTNFHSLKEKLNYSEMCNELMQDPARNYQIIKDVLEEYRSGNNIILLSERIEHLNILMDMLDKACDDVYLLSGEVKKKDRKITLEAVREQQNYILLATSKLLGEGFDLASLNCLFLVLPISSDTRITQYTGRIHRTYEGKDIVKVYDYIDAELPMAQSMYYKRLKQYEKEGYLVQIDYQEQNVNRTLFEKDTYEEQMNQDIQNARKEIVVFATSMQSNQIRKYYTHLKKAVQRGVSLFVVTSEKCDYDDETVAYLQGTGCKIIEGNHRKHFLIIDKSIVWNCSFCIFGNVPKDSFATRNENAETAREVIASVNNNVSKQTGDFFSTD